MVIDYKAFDEKTNKKQTNPQVHRIYQERVNEEFIYYRTNDKIRKITIFQSPI